MSSYRIDDYIFSAGDILSAEDGTRYTVLGTLGRGGQGEAYRVRGYDGEYAVKWYYPDRYLSKINSEAFQRNLRRNVENGPPALSSGDKATQFIWPLKMMAARQGSFGYLMRIFPQGYEPLINVVLGYRKDSTTGRKKPIVWTSWFARVTAALNIIKAFEILHASGYSFQDINAGGFSINLDNGSVFICDCDNVSPDKTNLGILGVKTFMAPEVIQREKLPDRLTDEYSLAVILFRLFLHGHPMEGQESRHLHSDPTLTDFKIDDLVYGISPHYCLDSKRNINPIDPKLDRDVFQLCLMYPKSLMDAFEQVFTEGVKDPARRLTATEWRKVLLDVRDHLLVCDGREMFFARRIGRLPPKACRTLRYPGGGEVLCMPGKALYDYHLNPYSMDFSTRRGRIIESKKPGVIGLYNSSGSPIEFSYQGRTGVCPDKNPMPLLPGMILHAGNTSIEIL